MIILYFLIAIFIGWIWIDYYRLIEIFDHENLKYFLLTYFLGGLSIYLVWGADQLLLGTPFVLNDNFINDFLYCVIRIGALEELAKLMPFLLIYFLFKKQFNEPIDYLAFISISALGFSAAENAMYFNREGPELISSRAILSTVGHMFDTSIIAYGIIIVKFRNPKNRVLTLLGFFLLAALSHGFYNFWLLYKIEYGALITILYFLITLSIFATILNNAMNNSNFFTYKKVIDSYKVTGRLLIYYGIVLAAELAILTYQKNFEYASLIIRIHIQTVGTIIIIAILRLSRFKLIQGRWENIIIELPFSTPSDAYAPGDSSSSAQINVKGDSDNEVYISAYYEEYFYLFPVSALMGTINDKQLTYIEKKIFLENDKAFYVAKLFTDATKVTFETRLLKPKSSDTTMMYDKYPIVAILTADGISDFADPKLCSKDFKFQEWAYIKAIEAEKISNDSIETTK